MTDDFVKRLRDLADCAVDVAPYETMLQAADRIEQLERVLLEIANAVGDPSAYWIARVALDKTDD